MANSLPVVGSAFMLHLQSCGVFSCGVKKRFRKIVTSGLVVSKEADAIRSVLFDSNIRVVNMGDRDQRDVFVLPHLDNMSTRPWENIASLIRIAAGHFPLSNLWCHENP